MIPRIIGVNPGGHFAKQPFSSSMECGHFISVPVPAMASQVPSGIRDVSNSPSGVRNCSTRQAPFRWGRHIIDCAFVESVRTKHHHTGNSFRRNFAGKLYDVLRVDGGPILDSPLFRQLQCGLYPVHVLRWRIFGQEAEAGFWRLCQITFLLVKKHEHSKRLGWESTKRR